MGQVGAKNQFTLYFESYILDKIGFFPEEEPTTNFHIGTKWASHSPKQKDERKMEKGNGGEENNQHL